MQLNLVYIDDEKDICEMFVDNFASAEVNVVCFAEPEIALKAIEIEVPDLIILDFRFPLTTGYEVAERIHPSIPLAVISGDLNLHHHHRFIKFFSKPFKYWFN